MQTKKRHNKYKLDADALRGLLFAAFIAACVLLFAAPYLINLMPVK